MRKTPVISHPIRNDQLTAKYDVTEIKNLERSLLFALQIHEKKTTARHNKAAVAYDQIQEQIASIVELCKKVDVNTSELFCGEMERLVLQYMGPDTSLGQRFSKERNTKDDYQKLMLVFGENTPVMKEGFSKLLPRRLVKALERHISLVGTDNITKKFKNRLSIQNDSTEENSRDGSAFKGTNPMNPTRGH